MANEQNLKPFPKGVSGNPAGYSRGRRAVDDLLDLIAEKKADKAIAAKWLQSMLEGDFRYFAAYLERRDGKVKDEADITVTDGTQTLRDFLDDDKPDTAEPAPRRKAGPKARPDR